MSHLVAFKLKCVPFSPQIVLLIAFMCITLLVASLVCLTLPGEMWYFSYTQTHHLKSTVLFTGKHIYTELELLWSTFFPHCFVLFVCFFTVFTGRWLMSFWTGNSKIHELYTAACGLYVCWLSIRGVTVLLAWMPQGRTVIVHKVQEWTLMVSISELTGLLANFEVGQQRVVLIGCSLSSFDTVFLLNGCN